MNLEQLKRLSINNNEDIRYFINDIDALLLRTHTLSPANLSISLSEALLSRNKDASIFIWVYILAVLMRLNDKNKETLTTSGKGMALIELINSIIKHMSDNGITFPHFEDFKSNARKILSLIPPTMKVGIYAMNEFFVDSLDDQLVPSLSGLLEEESLMIKSSVLGYKAFLNKTPVIGSAFNPN